MSRIVARTCCLCFIILSAFLPETVMATPTHTQQITLADFPTVNPDYIYDQLFYMVTHFQHRESGYTTNDNSNGHDAFAAYWTQEMQHNLQGFGASVYRDAFTVNGWHKRPATTNAFNVEVTVAGGTHPEQVVVIGCHYDGMAISTQSANDDASGCAIELGVAQAMANYWRSHHIYPARTLRFVIFDAEEQGLYGSFHYLNNTINGDVQNIVAMFNEEQNGIAYPLRYLGQAANPLLPLYIETSPLQSSSLYPAQDKLSQTQQDTIKHFRGLLQQAVVAAFAQFQALGFQGLTYHDENNQDHAQSIFTADQMSNIHQEDDALGSSDQEPFTLAGLPCATFVGNFTYYDNNPPTWSYPFDQTQDTIQLMNTFADGSSQKAHALTLSLALPGMLTTWMLHQPDILGEVHTSTSPFVTISDIGLTQVNTSIAVDATSAFDPRKSNTPLSYTWNFGDGQTANGVSVKHTYVTTGSYTLTLTASSATGTRRVSKKIIISDQPIIYNNPYKGNQGEGKPPHNPQVELPQANDSLSDRIVSLSPQATVTAVSPQPLQKAQPLLPAPFGFIVGTILLLLAIAGSIGITLLVTRKR
ncbi:MAG: hypothetical protein NVS4B11_16820 [Ktedonobacteraceae bacterium]